MLVVVVPTLVTRISFPFWVQYWFASVSAILRASDEPPATGAAAAETENVSGPILRTPLDLDTAQAVNNMQTGRV